MNIGSFSEIHTTPEIRDKIWSKSGNLRYLRTPEFYHVTVTGKNR